MYPSGRPFFRLFLLWLALLSSAWAQLAGVRMSAGKEKVRVVLDLKKAVSYRWYEEPGQGYLLVVAAKTSAPLSPVQEVDDVAVKRITISEGIEKARKKGEKEGQEIVEVVEEPRVFIRFDLLYPLPAKVFTLQNPDRIVVDLEKIFEEKTWEPAGEGLWLLQWRKGTPSGQVVMAGVVADLRDRRPAVATAGAVLSTRSVLKSLVAKEGAAAGINGGYFAGDGTPLGLLLLDGRIEREPLFARTAFFLQGTELFFGAATAKIEVVAGAETIAVSGLNRPRKENETVVYTPWFGESTGTNQWGKEWIVRGGAVSEIVTAGNAVIPRDGFVLSVHASVLKERDLRLKVGDKISLSQELFLDGKPRPDLLQPGVYGLGAGPRLLRGGKKEMTGAKEQFKSDVLRGRAPRSALGYDGASRLILLTTGGREGAKNIGASLEELAALLSELGAREAVNLDGGGSTGLVVQGRTVLGGTRPIPNAIVIK